MTDFVFFIIALVTLLMTLGAGILLGVVWCVSLFETKGGGK